MKRKGSITLGPGAASLILIFVVLALSMLSMLAVMNSRSDMRLGKRSIEVTEAVYALNTETEVSRAEVDAILAKAADEVTGGDGAADADNKVAGADNKADAQYLRLIAQRLPADMELEGRVICWTETDGVRNLHCAIEILPLGSEEREVWVQHTMTAVAAEEADDGLVEFD